MKARRSRLANGRQKIIIAGTGRAGTTFLMQLFTALDFNTGYSLDQAFESVDQISRAGLERPNLNDSLPYVSKSPFYADLLADVLANGEVEIHAALIPMRELAEAAGSRRRVYYEATRRGHSPEHPGALWYTSDPFRQEEVLVSKFYETIFPLVVHRVPIYLIHFPRLAQESDYLFEILEPLLQEHGVDRAEFMAAHANTARPEFIHDRESLELASKLIAP